MSAVEAAMVAMLEEICEAFNRHDLDAIMGYFVEDCVLVMPRGPHPWGQRYDGRGAVREGLATRFAGIPDVHYRDGTHWVAGNRGVSEWTLSGTSTAGEKIEVCG
ncbi:MAG TPA: nuclear transport factor 2 family protein, partial [Thermomicrobiales bacterium]|nr:nuclear transport factor 2 family protein [Thermomicrobiales bacterium]